MAALTRRQLLGAGGRGVLGTLLAAGLGGCGLTASERTPRGGGGLSLLGDAALARAGQALASAFAAAGGMPPLVNIGEPSLDAVVQQMLAGAPGIAPDCLLATPAVRENTQALPLMENLAPALSATGLAAGLYPACLQYGQEGTRQLLIPAFRDVLVVYYNADALARGGLTPPAPGWVLSDLSAICRKLRGANAALEAPLANVLNRFDLELLCAFVAGFGGQMVAPAQVGYVPRFASPAGAAAWSALAALHAYEPAPGGSASPRDLFTSGRAAFFFGHHADLQPIASAVGGLFAWDVAPLPAFPARAAQPVSADGIAVVTQDPARRTAAIAFALFAASAPGQQALAASGGGVPALRDLAASPTWRALEPPVSLDAFVGRTGADFVVEMPLDVIAPVLAYALGAVVAGVPAATALAEASTVAEYQLSTWQG